MVIRVIFGVFLVLHGLVHLLYLGQSARWFELQPGMTWPDGSWAITRLLGKDRTRTLAGICCILTTAGFVIAGLGIFLGQPWWTAAALASAALSGSTFGLLWNGRLQNLANQGAIALLINVALVVSIEGFRWPHFDF